jgi:hypothetical protein
MPTIVCAPQTMSFRFVEIPPKMLPIIGERVGDSRVYEKEGPEEEAAPWYDALTGIIGPSVSPGGVGLYCPVSRAAVYKRITDGKLSMFKYTVTHRKTRLFGGMKIVRESPYAFIPVSEAKVWKSELEERAIRHGLVTREELEGTKPDWDGMLMERDLSRQKAQLKKKGGKK